MSRYTKKKAPSWSSIIAGILASVLLGLVLGFAQEVGKYPEVTSTPVVPDEETEIEYSAPIEVYPGNSQSGSGIDRLIQLLAEGQLTEPAELTEGDLNQLASQYLNFSAASEQQQNETERKGPVVIEPGTPKFHLKGERLQLLIPLETSLFGQSGKAMLVLGGVFKTGGSQPEFQIEESWINSARLPPAAANAVLQRMVKLYQQSSPESRLIAGWSNLVAIRVQESKLILEPL